MDELLMSKLDNGEEILWRGKPGQFKALDKTHASAFWIKAAAAVAAVAAFIISYITAAAKNHTDVKAGLIGVVVVIVLYVVISPLIHATKIKKLEYAITDRQILVLSDTARGVSYDKIPAARFITDADGHTSLACGSDVDRLAPGKLRPYAALDPFINLSTDLCEHFILYAIDDADKVKSIVEKYVPIHV